MVHLFIEVRGRLVLCCAVMLTKESIRPRVEHKYQHTLWDYWVMWKPPFASHASTLAEVNEIALVYEWRTWIWHPLSHTWDSSFCRGLHLFWLKQWLNSCENIMEKLRNDFSCLSFALLSLMMKVYWKNRVWRARKLESDVSQLGFLGCFVL